MPVEIGVPPQADFSQPIELMKDCHRRIERFLSILRQVAQNDGAGKLPESHRTALQTALDYFAQAAPRHNADEDDSLFPALWAHSAVAAHPTMRHLETLACEHVRTRRLHRRIDALGRAWLAKGRITPQNLEVVRQDIETLHGIYQAHIATEEAEVFPLAYQILEASVLHRIGVEMQQRRSRPRSRGGVLARDWL